MKLDEIKNFASRSGLAKILGDGNIWLLWLGLQVPSLRPLYKYVPPKLHVLIFLYLVATFLIYAVILHGKGMTSRAQKILASGWLMVLFLAITLGVNYFVYPIADALKFQMRGSDQDDALIQVGWRLSHFLSPYAERTYMGNPISTGPGLVILLWPFLSFSRYFLITPVVLVGIGYVLFRISGSFCRANLFMALCLSSLAFWETMVVGSDMFAIGGLCVLCLVLIYYKIESNIAYTILGILMLALCATSRIIFLYLVPLVGLFLWKRRPSLGLVVGGFSLLGALLIHVGFYLWDPPNYTPLHLLAKGGGLLPNYLKAGLLLASLAVAWLTFSKVTDNLTSWLLFLWIGLVTPLAFVASGDLWVHRHFDFALWEGANYLILPFPALVAYIALKARGGMGAIRGRAPQLKGSQGP